MRGSGPGHTVVLALTLAAGALAAGGCAVGPDYHRPDAPTPQAYKELAGWKPITPKDAIDRGAWWSLYGEPQLDRLERQISISNQNIKSYQAQYAQAAAMVREVRSQLFPDIGASAGATRSGGGGSGGIPTAAGSGTNGAGGTGGTGGTGRSTQFQLEGNASWTPDLWGSIRRQLESQKAAAQVSAADLANALLSAQATVAEDYFDLRASDSLEDLLTEVVTGYRRTAQITENQYRAGTASRGDYMSALAQLQATQAQLIAVREARGQYEHAIAVLIGTPPGDFSIAHGTLAAQVPVVPAGLPSALLERNPAIAAAERQVRSDNALIGVAVAAYFPDVTLSSLIGFAGSSLTGLVGAADRVWSTGASATETLFDAGERGAAVAAARANYDQAVANYRQTVLSTFQTVEDQLLALHTLQDEAAVAAQAVDSARQAASVALNEYTAGTVTFTTVIVANETYLTDRQTQLTVQQNRLIASVMLIEALGGGWQQGSDGG